VLIFLKPRWDCYVARLLRWVGRPSPCALPAPVSGRVHRPHIPLVARVRTCVDLDVGVLEGKCHKRSEQDDPEVGPEQGLVTSLHAE
jgi:hypothetical protein